MIKEISQKHKEKAEASVFWSLIEDNLPKSREMSALGKEKVYQAFYPAYLEFRKHLIDRFVLSLENEKKPSVKEGEIKNVNLIEHEILARVAFNRGLAKAQEKLRQDILL